MDLSFIWVFSDGSFAATFLATSKLPAGVGTLWTASLHTTTYTSTSPAVMVESESRDRGFGPDLGAGLRLMLSPHVAISPEIRWLDASWLSSENLAITRLGIRTTHAW